MYGVLYSRRSTQAVGSVGVGPRSWQFRDGSVGKFRRKLCSSGPRE